MHQACTRGGRRKREALVGGYLVLVWDSLKGRGDRLVADFDIRIPFNACIMFYRQAHCTYIHLDCRRRNQVEVDVKSDIGLQMKRTLQDAKRMQRECKEDAKRMQTGCKQGRRSRERAGELI